MSSDLARIVRDGKRERMKGGKIRNFPGIPSWEDER